MRYIGDSFGAELPESERKLAVQQMAKNLDGSDSGVTVSKAEVEQHLRTLLKGNRVSEWVKHAVGLPQYVETFRKNSITSLDFPTMVSDDGQTLENDLGVVSKLHRQQIIRAIKRLMLGLGQAPSAPQGLKCQAVTCSSIRLSWQAPQHVGQPPMHKYKLERQLQTLGASTMSVAATMEADMAPDRWVTAHGELDDEDFSWQDSRLQRGKYQYRLSAWNAYAWSHYALVSSCVTDNTSLPCSPCEREGNCLLVEAADRIAERHDREGAWINKLGSVIIGGIILLALVISLPWLRGRADTKQAPVADSATARAAQPLLATASHGSEPPSIANMRASSSSSGPQYDPNNSNADPAGASAQAAALRARMRQMSAVDMGNVPDTANWRKTDPNDLDGATWLPGDVAPPYPRAVNSSVRSHPGYLTSVDSAGRGMGGPVHTDDAKIQMWLRGSQSNKRQGDQAEGSDVDDDIALPQHVDRNRCAHPGCHRKFNRLRLTDVKHALTRHYCSVCQNVYCHQHTQYSPHGTYGSCGMESKCICETCFLQLPRGTRDRLSKSNKLVKASSSGNLLEATKAGSSKTAGAPSRVASGSKGSPGEAPQTSGNGQPAAAQVTRLKERASSSSQSASSQSAAANAQSRLGQNSAARHWVLARNTLDAAYRFRKSGEQHRLKQGTNGSQK
ncbi:hypothetical protein WJX73_001518 [Symbiochloris irregularis]|uniref:SAM domain-containing protein n=1 Tax=Symbiochloris irregularis TaxID=706552 RepID=A0AAW1Q1E4_9CHLO